jgi:hypothetical protein
MNEHDFREHPCWRSRYYTSLILHETYKSNSIHAPGLVPVLRPKRFLPGLVSTNVNAGAQSKSLLATEGNYRLCIDIET